MDFDVVSGGGAGARRRRRRPRSRRPSPAVEARAEALAAATGDLPGALAAAIVDPGRIEVADEARRRGPGAVAARRRTPSGVALVVDDPRPLAGTPLALAVAGRGRAGRRGRRARRPRSRCATCWSGSGRRSSATRSSRCSPRASPRTPDAAPTPVAFDTQIAAYLVNAALRAQKIADVVAERLDLVLPPAAAGLPPTAVAGLEALSVARRPPVAGAGAARRGRRAPVRRDRAAADPDPRPDGGGRRSRSTEDALAALEREFAAEIARLEARDLRRRRPRVHDRHRPSSWARSCSSSWACPRAARRRPATRPTRRCSRSCAASTRSSSPCSTGGSTPSSARPTSRRCRRSSGPTAGSTRCSTRPWRRPAACPRPTRTSRTSRSARRSGRRIRHAFVAGSPGHDARRRGLQPDRAADPRPRVGRRAPRATRSPARPTSTARRPPACCARHPEDVTADERSMAKMVNFGLAYGMSDFGLSSRAGISRAGRAGVHQLATSRRTAGSAATCSTSARRRAEQGYVATLLGRKRQIPELTLVEPGARGRRRADGDQHADPGHGRGHRQDRDDPAGPGAARGRLPGPAAALGPRRAAARGAARRGGPRWSPSCARRWRARCRCPCR